VADVVATMPAYRLLDWGAPPQLVEVDVPQPGPGQVVIEVAACGLCHSDLAMMAMPGEVGEALGWSIPFTLGHESAGRVHALGAGVSGLALGDAVAVVSTSSCGRCKRCRVGRENACDAAMVGRGYGRDGGLAPYLLVDDPAALLPIGSLDPVLAAPLTDAGATSHHAVRRVLPRLPDDGTVVVIGIGGLGAFVVQILRARSGARIVALDPDPVRREVARRWGADEVLDGVHDGTRRELRALLGAEGADAAIDLVGDDATIATSLAVLAPGGAYGLVGAAGGTLRRPWYGSLPRDGEVFTFQGSDRLDALEVLGLAQRGAVTVEVERHRLDAAAAAYEALEAGGLRGRVVVEP
jgi:propanol-preferring alcohol dehydrogenase